ncbi:glycosyltransferase family 2 protein [Candidatus Daviesbacteria bacterium]|nr:glycosyltransferase family 2 protein [Candidatus Daviesbacteria bacterium]
MSPSSISVVIPIYNEAKLINKSIPLINFFLKKNFKDYEIIIIESGSTDNSYQLSEKLTKKYPKIKLISQKRREGFGSALRLGFQKVNKKLVWPLVIDLPYPLESILKALPYFDSYDCILSYRSSDNRSFSRKLKSTIYNFLAKIILNLPMKHINSAFKVYKKSALDKMKLTSSGWLIDSEILYQIKKQKISYIEIPIGLKKRTMGKSSINLATPIQLIFDLISFRLKQK